jgi:large subunit ribosomal protein L22
MTYHYATKSVQGARAVAMNKPISTKQSIELANRIRGKHIASVKRILEDVMSLERPVKFTRFNDDMGHKPGIGPGRFPIKTATHFLELLKSAEANASDLGMDTSSLVVAAVVAHKAASRPRYGRQRGREAKNTHVEIVLAPNPKKTTTAPKKTAKPADKPAAKQTPKPTAKLAEKSESKQTTEAKSAPVEKKENAETAAKPAPEKKAPAPKAPVGESS